VRFVLRAATWWTRSRGVAIGLDAADPALQVVATTSDAGRTWGLVLATHLRLRRPHVRRGGHVLIVADRCVRAGCFPSRIFSAGGFGRVWDQRGVPSRR
jgi:hypothetical protein